jgi:hypothetical protein
MNPIATIGRKVLKKWSWSVHSRFGRSYQCKEDGACIAATDRRAKLYHPEGGHKD